MPKAPFLEFKLRVESQEEKESIERAAREFRPVALSVNQWLLLAARAQLEKQGLAGGSAVTKKGDRR